MIFFPENAEKLIKNGKELRVKFGIDPTRNRLHLGHCVPLRICRKLQEQGHKLDLILGTLTAQLGDPSGQDKTRPILPEDEVKANADRLLEQVSKVLLPGFKVHRNHEFVSGMTVPFFLTRLASKFTVASMLARDAFKKRHEAGSAIALHEFLVPLLQGWDSVMVKAEVEVGGTDQLFNFQVARSLQEMEGQKAQVCVMAPIIRGTDGRKMSKTFDNVIWLDEVPDQMFGQVMSIPDDVAEEWMNLFCDKVVSESHPMKRKKHLAWEIVSQLHGSMAAEEAAKAFEQLVQRKEVPEDMPSVKRDILFKIVASVKDESNSGARKLILGGGVSVDGTKVLDPMVEPKVGSVIKIGKRTFVRIGA